MQTGLGPFLAACLAASGWGPARVGYALTLGGLVTVVMQTPAGAAVDAVHRKRLLVALNLGVLVLASFLLMGHLTAPAVYAAQVLIGGAAPFLGPAVAAITLGLIGAKAFDRQFGRNQAFNAAGNVCTALLAAYVSYRFGVRAIFAVAAAMIVPALLSLAAIDGRKIDYAAARGALDGQTKLRTEGLHDLIKDRVLFRFFVAALLFHLANAAMLPQLGEMLARNKPRDAAPFMSACIIVTQLVIAFSAGWLASAPPSRDGSRCCSSGSACCPYAERSIRLPARPVSWLRSRFSMASQMPSLASSPFLLSRIVPTEQAGLILLRARWLPWSGSAPP